MCTYNTVKVDLEEVSVIYNKPGKLNRKAADIVCNDCDNTKQK